MGSITSAGNISFARPISLIGSSTFSTMSGGGDITISNTVNGMQNLTLSSSGTGAILFSADVGTVTRLGGITVQTVNNFTAQDISASSFTQLSSTGTSTFNGVLNSDGFAGISMAGANFTHAANIITTIGGYAVTNLGAWTFTGSNITVDGSFTQMGPGSVSLLGTLRSNLSNISIAGPVTLASALTCDTSNNNGNIIFTGTIEGTQALTLLSGTGEITFNSAIGATNRLTSLSVFSEGNLSFQSVRAGQIVQLGGTGTTSLNGAVDTNTISGISISTANVVISAPVTTTAAGPLSINTTGSFTLAGGNVLTVDGSFTEVGSGTCNLNG